jgi:uncharacterized protein (DUF58 family)
MTLPQRIVLILLALSLFAGLATGAQIYYRLSYFWGFLYVGAWIWSAFSLRGLRLERTSRALRAQVGQVFEERYEVINESRLFRMWLEVRNESSLPSSGGSQVITLLPGRQRRIYWSQTLLSQRGVFPLGPTVLASGDLFGLFPRSWTVPAQDSLLVYPMMVEIQEFPNPAGLLPGGEALRRRTHQITPNASGVREYMPGDPLNRIHWTSTARRNRLMAKEFELDPLAEVWVVMDSERARQARLAPAEAAEPLEFLAYWRHQRKVTLPDSTEEYGLSICASLSRYFIRIGRSVGYISAGRHLTLLPPDRGGRQLGKILEALALSQAEGELPLRGLVETQAKYLPRGSTIILVTPTVDLELVFVVEFLLRRGLRPVAVLLNAETFGGPEGSEALAGKLRSLGVPVRLIDNGAPLDKALEGGYRNKLYSEAVKPSLETKPQLQV